jgi:nucleotide-binding universal stress UspA family protein
MQSQEQKPTGAVADSHHADPPRLVVGVDGSSGSIRALRFALAEARLRHGELEVVCAWRAPSAYGGPVVVPADFDFNGEALGVVHRALEEASDGADPGVAVTIRTVQGPAAQILIDVSSGADLLVVGTRGHGGFAGLLLGSVSQHCVPHAQCPVVVVPAADQAA